ncbi:Uncharacterized protein OBRU01_26701, partial [Operophtera brumata]
MEVIQLNTTYIERDSIPSMFRPHNQSEERYNEAQIATRNCVERCFGVWKQRFQCLLHGMPVKMENVKTTIVALAVLHNIAINYEDLDSDVEPNIEEPHHINEGSNNTRGRSSALLYKLSLPETLVKQIDPKHIKIKLEVHCWAWDAPPAFCYFYNVQNKCFD